MLNLFDRSYNQSNEKVRLGAKNKETVTYRVMCKPFCDKLRRPLLPFVFTSCASVVSIKVVRLFNSF